MSEDKDHHIPVTIMGKTELWKISLFPINTVQRVRNKSKIKTIPSVFTNTKKSSGVQYLSIKEPDLQFANRDQSVSYQT